MKTKTAIIGAGIAGLTALKALIQANESAIIFEKSNTIGGLWKFDANIPDGGGPAYESLQTNTSKQMTAFSDFPFPDDYPDFPSQKQVLEYLVSYVKHFELEKYIQFNHEVIQVKKKENKWLIELSDGSEQYVREFEKLIICSGRHEKKHVPYIQNIEHFEGKAIHSYSYKNADSMKNQTVLVVGTGSSGIDIAVESAKVAKRVYLSINSGSWIIPKTIEGKPYDHYIKKINSLLPKSVRENFLRKLLIKEYSKIPFDYQDSRWNFLFPEFDIEKARITPNSKIFEVLKSEKIVIKSNIVKTEGNIAKFIDRSKIWADIIICATGYKINFPFLNHHFIGLDDNALALHHHIFHMDHDNLAFVGMCNVAGPIMPLIEMQGKYVAAIFSNKKKLPSKQKMKNKVFEHIKICRHNGIDPMKVQTLDYLSLIAKEIKINPGFFRYIFNPKKLLMEPFTASRFNN